MRRRFLVTALMGALGVVATFTALAWACTPQAYIDIPERIRSARHVGHHHRQGLPRRARRDHLEWRRRARHGDRPGVRGDRADPQAEPGVYYISARGRDDGSGVIGRATRAFEVVAPPAPTVVEAPAATAQAPVATAHLETSGATPPRSSATRGERGQRANARTAQTAEAATPVAADSGRSVVADPVARTGDGEPAVTRASTAGRARSAPTTRAPRAVRRDRPDVAVPATVGAAARPAWARAAEPQRPADNGPGWPLAAALALLGCGVLTLLMVTGPRVARAVAARRRGATAPPVDEVVLPDDLLERLGAVLDEAADEAAVAPRTSVR